MLCEQVPFRGKLIDSGFQGELCRHSFHSARAENGLPIDGKLAEHCMLAPTADVLLEKAHLAVRVSFSEPRECFLEFGVIQKRFRREGDVGDFKMRLIFSLCRFPQLIGKILEPFAAGAPVKTCDQSASNELVIQKILEF